MDLICLVISRFLCVSEEPDRAGGGRGRGEPAAALRQHVVRETDPHLLQQTQHGEFSAQQLLCLDSLRLLKLK